MRYIFVCPDVSFLYLQYKDFELENNDVIRVGNVRRFAKISAYLRIINWNQINIITSFVYKKIFKKLSIDEEYCFIIYSRLYESFSSSIYLYLKNTYRNSKVVFYFGDLVSRHKLDILKVVKNSDKVFTFDKGDAQKYNLIWLLEPFSSSITKNKLLSEANNLINWDVTFVGHAKNRYEKIIEMYEVLVNKGLKCDFHIIGVPKHKRKYTKSIGYSPLSFIELLKHVVSSKCVVEVLQDNGASPTTRYTEAMLFGKNLLTDCKAFKKNDKRPPNIFYYEKIDDINNLDTRELIKKVEYEKEKYVSEFSIEKMIYDIGKIIELNDEVCMRGK